MDSKLYECLCEYNYWVGYKMGMLDANPLIYGANYEAAEEKANYWEKELNKLRWFREL